MDSGIGLPSSLVSSGFGSKRSTWLGEPASRAAEKLPPRGYIPMMPELVDHGASS
jgi:hypothetical protein